MVLFNAASEFKRYSRRDLYSIMEEMHNEEYKKDMAGSELEKKLLNAGYKVVDKATKPYIFLRDGKNGFEYFYRAGKNNKEARYICLDTKDDSEKFLKNYKVLYDELEKIKQDDTVVGAAAVGTYVGLVMGMLACAALDSVIPLAGTALGLTAIFPSRKYKKMRKKAKEYMDKIEPTIAKGADAERLAFA